MPLSTMSMMSTNFFRRASRSAAGTEPALVLGEHVAEERALRDGVVERLVRVGQVVEPVARHVALDRAEEVAARQGHREGLDVEGVPAEGVLAGEAVEIPADKHEVEGRGVCDEDRLA